MIELADPTGCAVAKVSARAAALRTLSVDSVMLVEPTAHRVDPPGMSGAVLIPWPNRVEDGVWRHEGRLLRLPVTEPELGHAIHGLLTGVDFDVVEEHGDSVLLGTDLDATEGYPFPLRVTVRYHMLPDGVTAQIEVTNLGRAPAPVAAGVHPYLRIGGWPSSELTASIDADYAWELDSRHIPRTRRDLGAAGRSARGPHRVGDAPGHILYERLSDDAEPVIHKLAAPDGRTVELRADPTMRWTQWYVAPALDTADGPRLAVAIEPMSAPPNALRSGQDVRVLDPSRSACWGWRIRLR